MPRKKKRRKQPPPPASLIHLIQTDPAVERYFQALQVNLKVDVQTWKDRALAYQSELLQLQSASKNGSCAKKKKKKKKSSEEPARIDEPHGETKGAPPRQHPSTDPQEGIPVDDSMFDFDDDSSEDETVVSGDQKNNQLLLQEAYQTLEQLGVSFFFVETPDDDDEAMEATAGTIESPRTRTEPNDDDNNHAILTCTVNKTRSCSAVMTSLLECIRSQRCDDTNHTINLMTAFKDEKSIFRALVILDTVSDSHELVDRFLDYLETEISDRWACADRSHRHNLLFVVDTQDNDQYKDRATGDIVNKTNLLRRTIFAKLYIGLQLLRHEHDTAARTVVNYIISNTPVPTVEDYPSLPPTLSIIVLESLLLGPGALLDEGMNWFATQVSEHWKPGTLFLKTLALSIHFSSEIWKERIKSIDYRIRKVAELELESYQRLCHFEASWFGQTYTDTGGSLASDLLCERPSGDDDLHRAWRQSLLIAVLLHGDRKLVDDEMYDQLNGSSVWSDVEKSNRLGDLLWVAFSFERQAVLRQLAASRRQVGMLNRKLISVQDFGGTFTSMWKPSKDLSTQDRIRLLRSALEAAGIVGDGKSVSEIVECLVEEMKGLSMNSIQNELIESVFDTIRQTITLPTVRVINLEGRKDRMTAFLAQGFRERLLMVKAVTTFRGVEGEQDNAAGGREFGLHAYDGRGAVLDATRRLKSYFVDPEDMKKIIASHWRPHDLKAFDRDAPDSEDLVRLTPSECACALSHISSWRGVQRSLKLVENGYRDYNLLRDPARLLRSTKIGGFAEGPPISNANVPPAPVCIILEDDAILVDRFTERLAALLKELPRDFHFCSLGYSRPKSAPIAKFSEHIGVPSMLWYLTGYILSESGAQFLSDQLPVVGPVDSWIGLMMVKNWDNIYGMRLGVGVHAVPHSEFKRSEFRQILEFKAFCSLNTLCAQKVGEVSTSGTIVAPTTGRQWRKKDTDVEYSGILK